VEDQIQLARRYCNALVRDLNVRITQFASHLVAAVFSFQPRDFFTVGASDHDSPEANRGVSIT
jgi:LemA protein